MSKGAGEAVSRVDAAKLRRLPSLHLVEPVVDQRGNRRSVLYADEAEWAIESYAIHVGGPRQTDSGILLAEGARPSPTQLMPVPIWRVKIHDHEGGRGAWYTLPLSGAHERVPVRLVPTDEADRVRVVPTVQWEAEQARSQLVEVAG